MKYEEKHSVHNAFKQLLEDPGQLSDLHAGKEGTSAQEAVVIDWLGRLKLLEGVPFRYLVAGEAMLPDESIRFFCVDSNWVMALIDGAYSLGSSTYGDVAHDVAFSASIKQKITESAAGVRAVKTGQKKTDLQKAESADADQDTITGFLLRSSAVRAFPGLEVAGYDAQQTALPIRRLEHLSEDILLCLFAGPLDVLELHNPAEGLHFGLDLHETGDLTKTLKSMNTTDPEKNGAKIAGSAIDISADFYRNDKNVLKMEMLQRVISDKLKELGQPVETFTSSEFALQMIEGVDMARLSPIGK